MELAGWTPETIQVLADSGVPMKVVFATDYSDGADGIVQGGIEFVGRPQARQSLSSPARLRTFSSHISLIEAGIPMSSLKTVNQPAADAEPRSLLER